MVPYFDQGDIIAIFSQYGEIVDLDKKEHFAFLCYENQKSTILAVDNLNGIKVDGRHIKVDHARYQVKKEDIDKQKKRIKEIYPFYKE
jgi:RNA recognition motif-containing protein